MNRLEQIAKKRKELLQTYPNLSKELTSIREKAVKNLSENLACAQESLLSKGCQVYHAATKKEAQEISARVLGGVEQVVRTRSNTLKEIEFDDFLQKKNIKVLKSHIEEIILDEMKVVSEGHPIIPYLDLMKEEVIDALQRLLHTPDIFDPGELNKLLHKKIKQKIIKSEFGVTGVNSIAAENGTIILAEDEGNARAVSNLPYRHLVVAGIDKITSSVEEAMTTIQGATIYGLGRDTPTYFSLISGPSRTADIEFRMTYGMHGPREVHVILLDNGRDDLIEQGAGDILKCIDCGACFESISQAAEVNNWSEVPFTAKGITLGVIQGRLKKPKKHLSFASFVCPVGIEGKRLGQILPRIKPLNKES